MNITFRQLRIFLSVAELGSITAAARASQPGPVPAPARC
jgi:hypothetical protein